MTSKIPVISLLAVGLYFGLCSIVEAKSILIRYEGEKPTSISLGDGAYFPPLDFIASKHYYFKELNLTTSKTEKKMLKIRYGNETYVIAVNLHKSRAIDFRVKFDRVAACSNIYVKQAESKAYDVENALQRWLLAEQLINLTEDGPKCDIEQLKRLNQARYRRLSELGAITRGTLFASDDDRKIMTENFNKLVANSDESTYLEAQLSFLDDVQKAELASGNVADAAEVNADIARLGLSNSQYATALSKIGINRDTLLNNGAYYKTLDPASVDIKDVMLADGLAEPQ